MNEGDHLLSLNQRLSVYHLFKDTLAIRISCHHHSTDAPCGWQSLYQVVSLVMDSAEIVGKASKYQVYLLSNAIRGIDGTSP